MAHQIKLATCHYCGRRTALQNTARDGHELACGSCGAPLHEMKAMPLAPKPKAKPSKPARRPDSDVRYKKPKKKKKRKGLWRKALEEAWDIVEDVFD